ncbi:MAG TPA: hypothetical protein VNF29_10950 [Candidatus Binataceae bacterium]|nr:hypothetical protein [Candidatus Binataceae bacterium]
MERMKTPPIYILFLLSVAAGTIPGAIKLRCGRGVTAERRELNIEISEGRVELPFRAKFPGISGEDSPRAAGKNFK